MCLGNLEKQHFGLVPESMLRYIAILNELPASLILFYYFQSTFMNVRCLPLEKLT